MITIISSESCPYCVAAKQLLESLGYKYEEKKVEMGSSELMEIVQISGMMTVPQIYVGEVARENLIWGYSELTELQAEWKLEERLG